jgi:hypothetical protein
MPLALHEHVDPAISEARIRRSQIRHRRHQRLVSGLQTRLIAE